MLSFRLQSDELRGEQTVQEMEKLKSHPRKPEGPGKAPAVLLGMVMGAVDIILLYEEAMKSSEKVDRKSAMKEEL